MDLAERLGRALDRVVAPTVAAASRAYYERWYYSNRWHPYHALLQDALDDTVAYIKSEMPDALIRRSATDVLTHALAKTRVDGLHLEFGVHSGRTITHVARRRPTTTIHGFDSFEGLPEEWSGYALGKGAFRRSELPTVPDNVELHIGWFDDTLAPFLAAHEGAVAFAHIDSDLYSSAMTVLDALRERIVPGTVIVFNEYFNYPNWRQHEFRAWQEFCAKHAVVYEYLCWAQYEVAVRVISIGEG